MNSRHVLIGVNNVYSAKTEEGGCWTISFHVAANGIQGSLLVPVDRGAFDGLNTLKVARNRLRIFSGMLADATVPFALTENELSKLRLDYQPDPLRR